MEVAYTFLKCANQRFLAIAAITPICSISLKQNEKQGLFQCFRLAFNRQSFASPFFGVELIFLVELVNRIVAEESKHNYFCQLIKKVQPTSFLEVLVSLTLLLLYEVVRMVSLNKEKNLEFRNLFVLTHVKPWIACILMHNSSRLCGGVSGTSGTCLSYNTREPVDLSNFEFPKAFLNFKGSYLAALLKKIKEISL